MSDLIVVPKPYVKCGCSADCSRLSSDCYGEVHASEETDADGEYYWVHYCENPAHGDHF